MLTIPDIRLATPKEAREIAELSRDCIEQGLGWSWTPARVLGAMRDPSTNVAVIVQRNRVRAFGIMQYGDDRAHLALLAVHPIKRNQRLGTRLLCWLEQAARSAGIERIRLEARADNHTAIAFYQRLGFKKTGTVAGYYEGVHAAVQLEKVLYEPAGQSGR